MKFLSLFRKTGKRAASKPPRKGKSELAIQLELAVSKKREAERKAAELQRQIDDIPKKIKEREEEKWRKIRDRAARTPTIRGLGRPVHRLRTVSEGVNLTRIQQRALRNRFLILCALLAVVLFILWRTVR